MRRGVHRGLGVPDRIRLNWSVTDRNQSSTSPDASGRAASARKDFLREKVAEDAASDRFGRPIHTRFPPEPNGFLHIGHAKSICLNFGIAREFGGRCNLRFDDTNPTTEDVRYVEAIRDDVRWLGFAWDEERFASDYFERLYQIAEALIKAGKAYVDSQSEEAIREGRGTVTAPGRPSPFRDRTAEDNLDLLRRMRAGEFPDGAHVLRARIDMAHPNMLMRDPLLLRIRHAAHYRRGTAWCLYPLYDFAHGLSDAFEGITHSLCTLEFKDNRELYDWLVREAGFERPPEQTEFARLELDYTVLSKRKLLRLVTEGHVAGWNDPRMPTIAGLRRRGVTPGGHPGLCRHDRRGPLRRADRAGDLRARRAGRSQPAGAPGDGRGAAGQAGAHQLPRGTGRDARRAALSP